MWKMNTKTILCKMRFLYRRLMTLGHTGLVIGIWRVVCYFLAMQTFFWFPKLKVHFLLFLHVMPYKSGIFFLLLSNILSNLCLPMFYYWLHITQTSNTSNNINRSPKNPTLLSGNAENGFLLTKRIQTK